MQSKGKLGSVVAGGIAIFLTVICLCSLSFSFVTSKYDKEAKEYALAKSGGNDDRLYDAYYKDFMDSYGKKPVYLGYTLKEAQQWGVGLGLDLQGGMNVILEVDQEDMLKQLAPAKANDPQFNEVMTEAKAKADRGQGDFITNFVRIYREKVPGNSQLFRAIFSESLKLKDNASDDDVISALKENVYVVTESAANNVLRKRIDQFGVVSPNIQILQGKDGQIMLELPGVKDHERVRNLLQRSAVLGFYNTYRVGEKADALNAFFEKALADSTLNPMVVGYMANTYSQLASGQGSNYVVAGYANNISSTDSTGAVTTIPANVVKDEFSKAIRKYGYILGNDTELFWGKETLTDKNDKASDVYYNLYLLQKSGEGPVLDGTAVSDASTNYDAMRGQEISMRMNREGAARWAEVTKRNAQDGHRPIAIVLDSVVYSAPNVNDEITGGSSSITGDFDVTEANDLANVLKSGKMTAKVKIISSMVIGPSLGDQAIKSGITSFVVALVLLMIFMCSFYGLIPGLIADFCLICNLFFTLGILASFQATLTMSGIAGIVLSLGMAVDANVLIFERAKEELRAGKNARTAISDGYSNAFSAIFDSNLTSIITGVILLFFGTGPIKGFATTLIIGIVCSFFTAVFLSRLFFIWGAKTKAFEKLTFSTSISRKMFVNAHYNFLGMRKVSFIVIGAIVVIVGASLGIRGLQQGIDFSGGRNYVARFDQNVDKEIDNIRASLNEVFPNASNQVITIESSNQLRISTNWPQAAADVEAAAQEIEANNSDMETVITGKLFEVLKPYMKENITVDEFSTKDSSLGLVSSQEVGPSVASDMRRDAFIAVALSLLAMFLYILLRFHNVAFSLGALAAVSFTALTIIGFYSIFAGAFPFAMEVDQSFIAAILTVIGYQINDTVVVFDRVRENLTLYPKQDFFTTMNQSLNSTLGRTIMTSASTLLVLICIFILGGDAIRSFVFAMLFGVIIGTLATIFLASPIAYLIDNGKKAKAAKIVKK
ncbi:MAG: protein translocase subunit SecDF [Muribaculaceae bacterium]|nr:protein translocase subunit SecDF [Muribaculaceae bacterium]